MDMEVLLELELEDVLSYEGLIGPIGEPEEANVIEYEVGTLEELVTLGVWDPYGGGLAEDEDDINGDELVRVKAVDDEELARDDELCGGTEDVEREEETLDDVVAVYPAGVETEGMLREEDEDEGPAYELGVVGEGRI